MLAACASSPKPADGPAPDPVVETRTVTRIVCPADLDTELGAPPQPAEDAVLQGNEPGLIYLGALIGDGAAARAVIADAKAACAAPPQE
jgi:hypothetical protein